MTENLIVDTFTEITDAVSRMTADFDGDFFEALIEYNVTELSNLRARGLTVAEWQKVYQYVLLKGLTVTPLEANLVPTPDSIGAVVAFVIRQLTDERQIRLTELGSGLGNLSNVLQTQLSLDSYVGLENNPLSIDVSASIADVMRLDGSYVEADAVTAQLTASDVVVSDLPVGYYPDDAVAQNFDVRVSPQVDHTYAHHLLIENGVKCLSDGDLAVFIAPSNLLTTRQAGRLRQMLDKAETRLTALITLPDNLFQAQPKAIYVYQKSVISAGAPNVHSTGSAKALGGSAIPLDTQAFALSDLTDKALLSNFAKNFSKFAEKMVK